MVSAEAYRRTNELERLGRGAQSAVVHGVALVVAAAMLVPFAWMLLTAFKTERQVTQLTLRIWPDPWSVEAFASAWSSVDFTRLYANSTLVAVVATGATLLLSSMAGFGFAMYRFRLREVAFVCVLATMMVPFQVTMIPLYLLAVRLKLQNTFLGILLPQLCSAFGVFLIRQFMLTIPQGLFDSARIDGCSEFRIYWSIALPLLKPALAALGVFTFMWSWDSFLWPLIIAESPRMRTLPVGLALVTQRAGYRVAYSELMAVSLIGLVPVVALFTALQRHFIQGITLSGLKY